MSIQPESQATRPSSVADDEPASLPAMLPTTLLEAPSDGLADQRHDWDVILNELVEGVDALRFNPPVAFVYNPLRYARSIVDRYLERFGEGPPGRVLLLGMNPGPFGMAQTGVPFGTVSVVRDWLKLEGEVARPEREHPKRPILGFHCPRDEVSGRRLWGWAREQFRHPAAFFRHYFVWNYCPLVFMDSGGRNLTPDKLPAAEASVLFRVCDAALRTIVERLGSTLAVGIGGFAAERLEIALAGVQSCRVGRILHPSPASPAANRGWALQATAQLRALRAPVGHDLEP